MHSAFVRITLSILFVCVCAAVGCGDDTTATPGGGSGGKGGGKATAGSGTTSKGPNCGLISASEVSSMLGVSGLNAPTMTVNSIVTLCQYGDQKNPNRVGIRYQTPTNASEFGLGKMGFTDNGFSTMDVSGIGDMAYSSSLSAGSTTINTLVFLAKEVEVEIVAPADFDKEIALGKTIIGKL